MKTYKRKRHITYNDLCTVPNLPNIYVQPEILRNLSPRLSRSDISIFSFRARDTSCLGTTQTRQSRINQSRKAENEAGKAAWIEIVPLNDVEFITHRCVEVSDFSTIALIAVVNMNITMG